LETSKWSKIQKEKEKEDMPHHVLQRHQDFSPPTQYVSFNFEVEK
jgi:hypothetical protein